MTHPPAGDAEPTYRILMVCTGNVCRSPVMERLFVARLRERLPAEQVARFEVGSAGTGALVGEPITAPAAETLRAAGGDPAEFVARRLEPAMIGADLVLTATRAHRAEVVTLVPRATARTLTLKELARLLGPVRPEDIRAADPVERMREIAAAALGNRGRVPAGDPADDDIPDPYRRPRAVYEAAAAQIVAALSVPLGLLLG